MVLRSLIKILRVCNNIFGTSAFLWILYVLSDFEGFNYFFSNKGSVFFKKITLIINGTASNSRKK